MDRIASTRFKLALIMVGISVLEGITYGLWSQFPLSQLLTFQGIVTGAYFGAKTATNIVYKKKEGEAC